jgi:hypothetical protein
MTQRVEWPIATMPDHPFIGVDNFMVWERHPSGFE